MILIALLIGVILIVAAIRNSQAALFTALGQDVPAYVVWAAALFAVGALGYIPGIKPVSRALLALVLIVIVLNNYTAVLNGFQDVASGQTSSSGGGSGGGTVSTANSSGTSNAGNVQQVSNASSSSNPYLGGNDSPNTLISLLSNAGDLTAGFSGASPEDGIGDPSNTTLSTSVTQASGT